MSNFSSSNVEAGPEQELASSPTVVLATRLALRYTLEDEFVEILTRTHEVARRSKGDMEGFYEGLLEAATWIRDHAHCADDRAVANLLAVAIEVDLARLRGDEEGARSADLRGREAALEARQALISFLR
ncbi:MAG TPA: hypothetical protein IAA39_07415 [Candidatus Olsenella avistercoris]|nr:hypothetical protein [Candidatus Olsenella avistercoris]